MPAVIMLVKDCAPKNVTLHIYGFNWPGGPVASTQSALPWLKSF